MNSLMVDPRRESTRAKARGWLRQDIPQIADLLVRFAEEYDSASEFRPGKERYLRWLNRIFNDSWHYFHVVRVAEDIVAIAGLARSRLPGLDGHLHSVYVAPEFRGYQFGRQVTEGVIAQAKTLRMRSLEMPMTTNPIARKLYESLGFETYLFQTEPHMAMALV